MDAQATKLSNRSAYLTKNQKELIQIIKKLRQYLKERYKALFDKMNNIESTLNATDNYSKAFISQLKNNKDQMRRSSLKILDKIKNDYFHKLKGMIIDIKVLEDISHSKIFEFIPLHTLALKLPAGCNDKVVSLSEKIEQINQLVLDLLTQSAGKLAEFNQKFAENESGKDCQTYLEELQHLFDHHEVKLIEQCQQVNGQIQSYTQNLLDEYDTAHKNVVSNAKDSLKENSKDNQHSTEVASNKKDAPKPEMMEIASILKP